MTLRIKELRQSRGWTQPHLADIIGVSTPHISEMETGRKRPSMATLDALACAFSVTVSDLFSDCRSPKEQKLLEIFRRIPPHKHDDLLRMLALAQDTPRQE